MTRNAKHTKIDSAPGDRLRVLTLNMQVGLRAAHYGHYLTHAWRNLLPSRGVRAVLDEIGELAAGYDVVALQEGDAGSLRTAQLNQIAYVAERAGHAHWQTAVNRDLGPFAQHCLGCLSREPLERLSHHQLPGWLPGRGALDLELRRPGYQPLRLIVTHLALGKTARTRQLGFLGNLLADGGEALVLGDLNCEPAELAAHAGLRRVGLRVLHSEATYPSWRPVRSIDHALATPGVDVQRVSALAHHLSDHLPVAIEIRLRPEPRA
jgi:endonuclease/exonuclease/phosphatase family metal-dependent hydrolase